VAAPAFLPAGLLLIWGLVMGTWMVVSERKVRLPEAAAQPIA
jgi:hypothetical protein